MMCRPAENVNLPGKPHRLPKYNMNGTFLGLCSPKMLMNIKYFMKSYLTEIRWLKFS